ncbi:MAG: hypothetical protein AB7D33_03360 [Sphingobium sp.]
MKNEIDALERAAGIETLWLKVLLWPFRLVLKIAGKMVLFILVYGLGFAILCRFVAIMVALFGLLALAMWYDGKPNTMPLSQIGLVFLGAAYMWGIAAAWQWLLNRMLPKDEVLIQPYN